MVRAVADLEEAVTHPSEGRVEGVVLRYGYFYGPGTVYAPDGSFAEEVGKRRVPIVGGGEGVFSFIHIDDAAAATVASLSPAAEPGTYNVVDDDPAPAREWLPFYADAIGAPPPRRIPRLLGRLASRLGGGAYAVYLLCDQPGASNAKAKRSLGFAPRYPTWREGFRAARG